VANKNNFSLPPLSGYQEEAKPQNFSRQGVDLTNYSVEDLLELRARVDAQLPPINIEKEIVLQLLTAQKLQRDTLTDENTPANQKAQVLNSAASALQALAKLQGEVHDSERLKIIEGILVGCVKTLPHHTQEEFFYEYELQLGESGRA
jgi:hypothetical protein